MSRFAVGGFQHETNTFATTKANWESFVDADFWPGLTTGDAMRTTLAHLNIPISGAMDELALAGHEVVELSWCAAGPSAHIEDAAFDSISDLLLGGLRAALASGPLDGVYFDLHGAGTTETFDDAEAELLRRVRSIAGDRLPIAISLDLHANVSRGILECADIAVAYRTYPHVDMATTGRAAARHLIRLASGWRLAKAFVQIPFLIPEIWQCTLIEPAHSIYNLLRQIEVEEGAVLSFCQGFPLADVPDCGPSVIAYADEALVASRAAGRLAEAVTLAEGNFQGIVLDEDTAVRDAMLRQGEATTPTILADVQDNPGGGGNANTVGLLHALLRSGADAVSAVHWAPSAAALAHRVGVGGEFIVFLGGDSAGANGPPLEGRVRVERIGDGKFVGTGPMYGGSPMDLGPMALLCIVGPGRVRVIVSTRKFQAADQSIFRHLGIEPSNEKIIALKSQVHFRADFGGITDDIAIVRSPGPVAIDTASLPWQRLRPGIRLAPLGPVWHGPSERRGAACASRRQDDTKKSVRECETSLQHR
jgi:microcystin degradation protein MlrC